MSWNAASEIFDVERTFEPRREEAAKGRDQRSEARHSEQVELIRRVGYVGYGFTRLDGRPPCQYIANRR
jgi:hypothetical protein